MKKIRAISVALAVLTVLFAALALSVGAKENQTVEAKYFNKAPVIDGVVSVEEWGQPSASAIVYTGRNDYKYDDDDNVLCSPACFADVTRAMYVNDMSFDMWYRWDNQFFYIAVVSKDMYGYSNNFFEWDAADDSTMLYVQLWEGDTLQFGIHPSGANSNGDPTNPFSSDGKYQDYCFVLGCTDLAMTDVRMRNEKDWTQWVSGYKAAGTWNPGVWPTFGGEPNSDAGYITYELAMPYSLFDGDIASGKANGFGVTMARVSCTPANAADKDGNIIGTGGYDGWLSWGDGIMGSLKDQLPEFRCGNNSVILVDTPAVGSGSVSGTPVIAPVTETETEAEEGPEAEEETAAPAEGADAEEETDAEAAEETEEGEAGENETEDKTEEVTEAEFTVGEGEQSSEPEAAEGEKTGEAEDVSDKSVSEGETKAASAGLPVGAIIGIVAAVIVIAGVVIALLAKKKKN